MTLSGDVSLSFLHCLSRQNRLYSPDGFRISGRDASDVFVCREDVRALPRKFRTHFLLFPAEATLFVPRSFSADGILSCGMTEGATLSFSSIGETEALLTLSRAIPLRRSFLEPMEVRVPFARENSIYRNLTHSFCLLLAEHLASEEQTNLETLSR